MTARPGARLESAIERLDPAYFALVMATGIVSVASELLGFSWLARGLLALNVGAYLVLWVLYLWRLVRFPRSVRADLGDHPRACGYFTLIAGTCVLGTDFLVVVSVPVIATALWSLGLCLYLGLVYFVFTRLATSDDKPTLANAINGGWLIAIVATQALSVLGTQVSGFLPEHERGWLFFSIALWLVGSALYTWVITLIFYRHLFFPMKPEELAPTYWINMGAMAISTLAGALLTLKAEQSPLIARLSPFIEGTTLLCWATATWWIPLLLALGFWRHVVRRVPLRYDPSYWGMVFPLGMYTVCTVKLSEAPALAFLGALPPYFIYAALLAWACTFYGLLAALGRGLRRNPTCPGAR